MQKKLRGRAAQARWAECHTAHNGSRAGQKSAAREAVPRAPFPRPAAVAGERSRRPPGRSPVLSRLPRAICEIRLDKSSSAK